MLCCSLRSMASPAHRSPTLQVTGSSHLPALVCESSWPLAASQSHDHCLVILAYLRSCCPVAYIAPKLVAACSDHVMDIITPQIMADGRVSSRIDLTGLVPIP